MNQRVVVIVSDIQILRKSDSRFLVLFLGQFCTPLQYLFLLLVVAELVHSVLDVIEIVAVLDHLESLEQYLVNVAYLIWTTHFG